MSQYPNLSPSERQSLNSLNVQRVLKTIDHYSNEVGIRNVGTGVGSLAAGTKEEKIMAQEIYNDMKEIGLDEVCLQPFPVQKYDYEPVQFRANGVSYPAISLHGAGGSYGTVYGAPFFLGNANNGKRVVGELVDAGAGTLQDYENIGSVEGKVVIIYRRSWPVYEIIEAANRGARALIIWGNLDSSLNNQVGSSFLKQDVMYRHLQLPVVAVSEDTYNALKAQLDANQTVNIGLENRMDMDDGESQNVIGKIIGHEFPEEYIMISAHYDRWFKAAADNMSGVAAMLELARFVKNNLKPRRTFVFMAVGSEEAGIYDSENDWLAGSYHFVQRYPGVMRRLAYALNLDIYGWTNDDTLHEVCIDLIPFHEHTVEQANTGLPVVIEAYSNSNVDSWVYCKVAGGTVVFPGSSRFLSGGAPLPGYDYNRYYHTDHDIYSPDRFQLLDPELRISATGLILADKSLIVPVDYNKVIEEFETTLNNNMIDGIDYSEVVEALDMFKQAISCVTNKINNVTDICQAKIMNRVLMNLRKEIMPWLYSASGFRITLYNRPYSGMQNVISAAESNDVQATLNAIEGVRASGWWAFNFGKIDNFLPETFERQRLYYYVNDDWRSAYDQKAELISEVLDRIYYRLQNNETQPIDELESLNSILQQVIGNINDSLTITDGKLKEGVELIERFFPGC